MSGWNAAQEDVCVCCQLFFFLLWRGPFCMTTIIGSQADLRRGCMVLENIIPPEEANELQIHVPLM